MRLPASGVAREGIAAGLVTTIRDANPHGPYILGGYCIGGIFAYEVAQQIRASGEEVPLLVASG